MECGLIKLLLICALIEQFNASIIYNRNNAQQENVKDYHESNVESARKHQQQQQEGGDGDKCMRRHNVEVSDANIEHVKRLKNEIEKLQDFIRVLKDQQHMLSTLENVDKNEKQFSDQLTIQQIDNLHQQIEKLQRIIAFLGPALEKFEAYLIPHEERLLKELEKQNEEIRLLKSMLNNMSHKLFEGNATKEADTILKSPMEARKTSDENLEDLLNGLNESGEAKDDGEENIDELLKSLTAKNKKKEDDSSSSLEMKAIIKLLEKNQSKKKKKKSNLEVELKKLEKQMKSDDDDDVDNEKQIRLILKKLKHRKPKSESKSLDNENMAVELKQLEKAIKSLQGRDDFDDVEDDLEKNGNFELMLNKLVTTHRPRKPKLTRKQIMALRKLMQMQQSNQFDPSDQGDDDEEEDDYYDQEYYVPNYYLPNYAYNPYNYHPIPAKQQPQQTYYPIYPNDYGKTESSPAYTTPKPQSIDAKSYNNPPFSLHSMFDNYAKQQFFPAGAPISGSNPSQSYPNQQYANEGAGQKVNDLKHQINQLQNVINSYNQPEYTQQPNDKATVHKLDKQIKDLKYVISNLSQDVPPANSQTPPPPPPPQQAYQQQQQPQPAPNPADYPVQRQAKRYRRSEEREQLRHLFNTFSDAFVDSADEDDVDPRASFQPMSLDDVHQKILDVKQQLEQGLSHPERSHYNSDDASMNMETKSKKNDVFDKLFEKIINKVIDKVIVALPRILDQLPQILEGIFGSFGLHLNEYEMGHTMQGFGLSGILPMLIIKILTNFHYFIMQLQKFRSVRTFIVPLFILGIVAGSVLFLIWWLQPNFGDESSQYENTYQSDNTIQQYTNYNKNNYHNNAIAPNKQYSY